MIIWIWRTIDQFERVNKEIKIVHMINWSNINHKL